ncbi:MAG: immunoglobulin domain-containing protein, partial [Ginsengibacter sp.]
MKTFFTTSSITATAKSYSNNRESIAFSKQNPSQRHVAANVIIKIFILGVLLFQYSTVAKAQQVTEIVTDFGGFWKSGVGALNTTNPNTSHNLLSFKYNSIVYSTGADDNKLSANGISYAPGDFRGFPIATIGGTITGGTSVYIALASRYDGIPNGFSNPWPSLKMNDVLIDGIHGLDLGTGVTNIPASAIINFPISTVKTPAISDAQPDIVVTQIADPSATGDTLYFINSSGAVVGNKLSINWTAINKVGTYYLDLYTFPNGALCDTAKINGTFDKETTRDIRLLAFKLSDFGITIGNAANVTGFILRESGTSDPAFIAYNTDAFTIPAPEISVQPLTQVVCPNASNSVTFSVTATGGSLSYQWRKNNADIPGATNKTYTISNVTASSAGAYNVIVTNPIGSVASNIAYLNVSIAVQPSPSAQLIATGAICTLSISANNATSYQWKKAGADISGANSATYVINPVSSTDSLSYSVLVINSAGSGCANISSNVVTVTGSNRLYSKAGVNLNVPGSWGVVTDGSGSSPVNFSRAEHTFIIKNNAATGGDLTVAGTLDIANSSATISANTTLDAGKIIRSGSGAIAGSATSNLTVRDTSNLYFKTGNNILKNFTIYGGNITLLNSLSITAGSSPGTVTLNGGNLFTGDSLTIKSDISGTAAVATVSVGATITGQVTVERFIPGVKKAWRFLAVPTIP